MTKDIPQNEPDKAASKQADAMPGTPIAVASSQDLSRRLLFLGGLGVLGFACSDAKFDSGNKNQRNSDIDAIPNPPEPVTLPAQAETGTLEITPVTPTQAMVCPAFNPTRLDLSKLNSADPMPTAIFYGRQDSALLAVLLPAGIDVTQVLVVTSTGKLLALHGITGADKKSDGNWRPIILDNLILREGSLPVETIFIVMQVRGIHVKAPVPVVFMRQFMGKPVVDLSGRTVPSEMNGRQSVAQFAEVSGTFQVDPSVTYPTNAAVRNLQTAIASTAWTAGAGIQGTITDIMGNVLQKPQLNIIEYQVFCTYVETPTVWVRTMIQVG